MVDVDVYHAFTLLRKLEKDDETGLVVSHPIVSHLAVPLSLSLAGPLLRGFASLLCVYPILPRWVLR